MGPGAIKEKTVNIRDFWHNKKENWPINSILGYL